MDTCGQGRIGLRVSEVVVHRNGVGHFTYEGTVVADQEVRRAGCGPDPPDGC